MGTAQRCRVYGDVKCREALTHNVEMAEYLSSFSGNERSEHKQ